MKKQVKKKPDNADLQAMPKTVRIKQLKKYLKQQHLIHYLNLHN